MLMVIIAALLALLVLSDLARGADMAVKLHGVSGRDGRVWVV
jgi:hypothetical protein